MAELRSLYDTDIQQRQPDLYTPRESPLATIDPDNIAQSKQQLPTSPIVSGIEERLKAEGSNTSTLSHITAWLGAAKGDFRGIQAIEDSKRRTALAKSMVPELTRVNKLIQTGEWEKASEYVNELAGSYGTRAEYLVPYFQQMQADIKKKQEGWQNLKSLHNFLQESGEMTEDNINYPVFKALGKAIENRDYLSETNLQGIMTRYGSPHTQLIDGRVTQTSLLSGKTKTETLPQVWKASDLDTYTGIKAAAAGGMTIKDMTDLMNGRTVKREDGTVVEPNSREAQLIKAHYVSLQPQEARLKIMQRVNLEPALYAQLLNQGVSPESIALGEYGKSGSTMQEALTGQSQRLAQQTADVQRAVTESNPVQAAQSGFVTIGIDPKDAATFLKPQQPMPLAEVKKSGKRVGVFDKAVYDKQVVPAFSGIQTLDTIPEILKINPIETKGDVLEQGVNQMLSRFLGYPVTKNAEIRQEVRTRLNRAIEQAENIIVSMSGASGHDDKDIATWKAFATGDFRTNAEVLKAVDEIRNRLNQVLDRAVSTTIPKPSEKKAAKSPVSAIAPLIPSAKGQVTRQPYNNDGSISLPEVDPEIAKMVMDRAMKGGKDRGVTIRIPDKSKGGASTIEETPTQPVPFQPSTPPIPSAQDRVKMGIEQKRMRRMR